MGAYLFYMLENKKKAKEFNEVMGESDIGKRLIKAHSFCGVNDEFDIEIAKKAISYFSKVLYGTFRNGGF